MRDIGRYKQARKVTLVGAGINLCLAIIKVVFGIFGHSQALFADGVHSFSDLISDFFVLMASKAASHGPDQKHPYGHGRIETIATVVLSLLLIIVGFGIVGDAIHSIMHPDLIRPSIYGLIVAFISIVANEWLFRYTLRTGNNIHSNLLNANAWHHRSDAFSSLVVLIGIGGAILGIHYLDAIAAIIVALMVVKMGVGIGWKSIQELIDTGVDENLLQNITKIITDMPEVWAIHQLRTRLVAGWILVEVHVLVDAHVSVSEGHHIANQVIKVLKKASSKISDVLVHIDSEDDAKVLRGANLPNRTKIEKSLKKCWHGLTGHDQIQKINLHYLHGKVEVELFLPMSVLHKKNDAEELQEKYQKAICNVKFINSVKMYFVADLKK